MVLQRSFIPNVNRFFRLIDSCPFKTASSFKFFSTLNDKKDAKNGDNLVQSRIREAIYSGAFSFLGIGCISAAHYALGEPNYTFILSSFGASAFLLSVAPKSPFAQPRAIIGGHFIGALCGTLSYQLINIPMENFLVAAPVGVSLAAMGMVLLGCAHPPAGGTALATAIGSAKLAEMGYFVLVPTVFGSISLVAIAAIFYKLRGISYPSE